MVGYSRKHSKPIACKQNSVKVEVLALENNAVLKLNKQTRYVRGEKIDVSTMEGEREYDQALKYRQDENVALGYPAEPWNLKKYKKSRKKFGL